MELVFVLLCSVHTVPDTPLQGRHTCLQDFYIFADFLFFMPASFFYFIFARLEMKKEEMLIVNKQTRQLHLLPPGHRRRSLCQAPLHRWDSPPQAPLALTRSTSQGLGVPGRHRDPGPGASLHTSANIVTHPAAHILKSSSPRGLSMALGASGPPARWHN